MLTYAPGTAQSTHDTHCAMRRVLLHSTGHFTYIPTSSRGERFVIGVCFVQMFGESLQPEPGLGKSMRGAEEAVA